MNNIISLDVQLDSSCQIGKFNIIGRDTNASCVKIGSNLKLGSYSKIEDDVVIGSNCQIGDYCGVYYKTEMGDNVVLEHGSKIFARCKIGNNVIINANVSQRVIMEDGVKFFGRIAHSHRNHTVSWKDTIEPSPVFKKNSFIGINALIIGDVIIGENSYISAGEIVRTNIEPNKVVYKGKVYDKGFFKGLIV